MTKCWWLKWDMFRSEYSFPSVHKAIGALLCLWASWPQQCSVTAKPAMLSPTPPLHSLPPPTLPEIVFLLGHLSTVGSCRCCWWLWSREEVPATPESKCFFFHFPVLVFFFQMWKKRRYSFGSDRNQIFVTLLSVEHTGKPALCVLIFVSSDGGSCVIGEGS